MPGVEYRNFLGYNTADQYDVVVANHVLHEITDEATRRETVQQLWTRTRDFLVLIERGNPQGFDAIAAARDQILLRENGERCSLLVEHDEETGRTAVAKECLRLPAEARAGVAAHVVAPCPHDGACPLWAGGGVGQAGGFCHFPVAAEFPAQLMRLVDWKRTAQTSKYSYVVLRRGPRPSAKSAKTNAEISSGTVASDKVEISSNKTESDATESDPRLLSAASHEWPRLARKPLKRSGHVILDMCHPNGSMMRGVASKRQGRLVYRDARKAQWGDLWPHDFVTRTRSIDKWDY